MSFRLVNKVRPMTGLSFAEKSVLFQLVFSSHDDQTVFLRLDKLASYTGCSVRTVQRALRGLEEKGILEPQGATGGRGYVQVWKLHLEAQQPPDEDATEPALPAIPSPREETKRQFKAPNWKPYDDPLARKPDETAMQYAARVDRLRK